MAELEDIAEQRTERGDAMKRFLLVGYGGFYNRGCEAIVRGTLRIVRDAFPDNKIMLRSHSCRDDPDEGRDSRRTCRQRGWSARMDGGRLC